MLKISGAFLTLLLALCAAEIPLEFAQKLLPIQVLPQDIKAAKIGIPAPPKQVVDELNITFVGKWMTSSEGRSIAAYQGIKYAEMTERFKHSVLVPATFYHDQDANEADDVPNDGEIISDQIAKRCVQRSNIFDGSSGQEDCLYLNVYVPVNATESQLPVMVFIHGGSFRSGDASLYMPTRFLNHDVILVTIHYRLAAFGWLSAQTENVPGNAGLSDQMNSLRWVQKYITGFGGDPSRVTVFGQSAGSASSSWIQTVAPRDERLFTSMIGESGSALDYWAIDNTPLDSFKKLAEICGCKEDNSILSQTDCLKGKDALILSDCSNELAINETYNGQLGFAASAPVVQAASVGEANRLISKASLDYIMDGDSNNVPILMGANRDEGSFVLGELYLYYLVPHGYDQNVEYLNNQLVPDIVEALGINDPTQAVAASLKTDFFANTEINTFDDAVPGLIDMLGALMLKGGGYQTSLYHSQYQNTSTFFYSFEFESDDSMFDWLFGGFPDGPPFAGGVTHADELMYVFSLPSQNTPAQKKTSERLTKLWTNFAASGNPTPDGDNDDLGIPEWEELDSDNLSFLLINDTVNVKQDYPTRWHIDYNEAHGMPATDDPNGPESTNLPYPDDYEQIQKDRQDFLITMIVFIVAFVVAECAAVYFWFKARG